MEDKKETALLRCRCGDPRPVVAKIKPGRYIVACNSCPTHAIGSTEEEAKENWNVEVQR
jgi:hypothetical protein